MTNDHVCGTCPLWERLQGLDGYGRCKGEGPGRGLPLGHTDPYVRGGWYATHVTEGACGLHPKVAAALQVAIDDERARIYAARDDADRRALQEQIDSGGGTTYTPAGPPASPVPVEGVAQAPAKNRGNRR